MAELTLRAMGNAGFSLVVPNGSVVIDGVWGWDSLPRRGDRSSADVVLVTHGHWDHFDPKTVEAAGASLVVAPPRALRRLRARGSTRLVEAAGKTGSVSWRTVSVTWFATIHGDEHVSYLVEMGGFRVFHDGDNESTRVLPLNLLKPLDVLLLCPWQGSGWEDFVQALDPSWWVLSHLTPEEIQEHRRGCFLPQLASRVPLPERSLALEPGECLAFVKEPGGETSVRRT